jgi:hypothetical protein
VSDWATFENHLSCYFGQPEIAVSDSEKAGREMLVQVVNGNFQLIKRTETKINLSKDSFI